MIRTPTESAITPTITEDSTALPLASSVLLHVMVLAGIVFWQHTPTIAEPVAMQASLVGAGEFADIQSQLQASATGKSTQTNQAAQSQSTPSQPMPSDAISQYNAELAERQAAYRRQQEAYAAQIDAEMAANFAAHEQMARELAREQRQEVLESKKAEQQQDDIIKQNQAELDEARTRRDEIIAQAEDAARQSAGTSGSLSNGAASPNTSSQSQSTKGSNNSPSPSSGSSSTSSAGKGKDSNAIASAIASLVYPNWSVPAKSSGQRLTARVRVDASGNVLSVTITSAGNAALKDSLEKAIYQSSPLTPVVGTEIRSLNLNFVAN